MSVEDEIATIEKEIRDTPYNKATSHHIGKLKAKIAKLREELQKRASAKGGGEGYSVKKSGHATVTLVGFPSVGKSTLLNKLTGAKSEIGAYEFTTLDVIPGVLEHNGATIQILDVPGLVRGAASGRGRGKEVIAVVRNSDLVVFVLDVFQTQHYEVLKQELYDAGVRLDTTPPDVVIKRQDRGGIPISTTLDLELPDDLIKAVLGEYKIHNAHVLIRDHINLDELIDVIMLNRVYIPSVVVINKVDLADEATIQKCRENFPDALLISANEGENVEKVKDLIYDSLDFIRVYLKPQGEAADMDEPLIITYGSTIGDVCDHLHRDFRNKFRYAQIWGDSAKHPGQRAGLEHTLEDGDILTVIIQK
ncbi:small GTP-binding protein [Methanohalophilus levihalophilus]|uniref:OBG GTPase family GTP-binding protein n=1 Tax=Methanohalophilus levihalophilus TaxID=1431282 RepID=UPI001AE4F9EE|nr:GTP-binding protein [Methanohalophilus levihalophilus]MBP2030661.1 small GTP-binding protein [Methanohalophilus levihalophilus]